MKKQIKGRQNEALADAESLANAVVLPLDFVFNATESQLLDHPVQPEFTERVLREATRRRFCQAERQVVIGDGAPWIWNIRQELFPHAIEIVDRFHAKQHLSDLGKALFGPPIREPRSGRISATRNSTPANSTLC